jgi:hypothetical protein
MSHHLAAESYPSAWPVNIGEELWRNDMCFTRNPNNTAKTAILVCLTWLAIIAQGYGTVRARQPVPPVLQDEAQVKGMPDVRGYADSPDGSMYRSAVESIRLELAAQPGKPAGVFLTDTVDILALSGGGADGVGNDRSRPERHYGTGPEHHHQVAGHRRPLPDLHLEPKGRGGFQPGRYPRGLQGGAQGRI